MADSRGGNGRSPACQRLMTAEASWLGLQVGGRFLAVPVAVRFRASGISPAGERTSKAWRAAIGAGEWPDHLGGVLVRSVGGEG